MLYFVGVGPGDPELITLKAQRVLRQAQAIVLPDSGKESVVWGIVKEWIQDKPLLRVEIPMKGARAQWENAHSQAVGQILSLLEKYETVAYPVLGDPSIYASSSYLMERILPSHPCRVIPGIPAMCAAAAQWRVPLCIQGETLTVLGRLEDAALPNGPTVVMKSGRELETIRTLAASREIYAACDLGMEHGWAGRLEEFPEERHSYFTTVLVR